MAVYKVPVCQKPQNINCFSLKEQQILLNRDFIILLSLKVALWKKDFLSDVVYLLLGRVFEPKKTWLFLFVFYFISSLLWFLLYSGKIFTGTFSNFCFFPCSSNWTHVIRLINITRCLRIRLSISAKWTNSFGGLKFTKHTRTYAYFTLRHLLI